jgi:CRP-like cAMP-binding protein
MAVEKLEKHEIFGLLSPTELSELSSSSGIMNLHEGDRVCTEGHPATHFFVLLTGRVELRKRTREGPSFLVDDLLPGSVFGISSVADGARYFLDGECVEDSEVLKIEADALRHVLDVNPQVGYATQRRLSKVFYKRYVDAMEWVQEVVQAIPMRRASVLTG